MTRPPRLAEGLVRTLCPSRYSRLVLCDLAGEFYCRDPKDARAWYWRNALASIGPLVLTELRRGNWQAPLLALVAAGAGPAVLLNAWWSFVLSQVPLKASEVRGADFAAIELAAAFLLALAAGAGCTRRGLWLAVPAGWGCAWLGQAAAGAAMPGWFGAANLGCIGLGLAAGAGLARGLAAFAGKRGKA